VLPTNCNGWAGGRVVFALLVAVPLLASDAPLFPVPLHLVRRVEDPIASSTTEVDEYCTGNKIITIHGAKTAIVDYERQELLEIDRAASTYSVASFEEIAAARAIAEPSIPRPAKIESTAARESWKTTPLGSKLTTAGRSADSFEITTSSVKVEVAVDRQVTLSRAALDAISGASYPNKATDQQEAIARACARTADPHAESAGGGSYGLPLDQSITVDADPKTHLTIRNSIVRVTNDLPPPEMLAIPAGAALVESRPARMVKQLRQLEQAPKTARP
jgi:hypothetical protein